MATILNIETATEVCSISLAKDGKELFCKENTEGLNHSELLTVYIEDVFKENNIDIRSIDAIAVSKGPGSYTGLRIGVSVAKGLCYGLEKPLISVGTLDALGFYTAKHLDYFLAEKQELPLLFCPMIDARRMEVYTALYDQTGKRTNEVSAKIIDEKSFNEQLQNHKILFFGNGAEKCNTTIVHPNALFLGPLKSSARFMQPLSEEKFKKQEFEDVAYFEPFYLKNFVATVPKNKVLK